MVEQIFIDTNTKFKQAVKYLAKHDVLACDTETDGLEPYTATIWSVQLGTKEKSYLFPYSFLNDTEKIELGQLTKGKLLIAHNAKFDAKMMKLNGFIIDNMWCTQEAEKVMYAGKYFQFGLKDLLKRYFKLDVDKDIRDDFWDGTFTELVNQKGIKAWSKDYIDYALDDIAYLIQIYEMQLEQCHKVGLDEVLEVEAELVLALTDMELRGVRLDDKALKKFKSKVLLRKDELEQEASQQLEKFYHLSYQKKYAKMIKIYDEWKLLHEEVKAKADRDENDKRRVSERHRLAMEESLKKKPYQSEPKPESEFNLASPLKLKEALCEALGMELTTTGKEWLEDNVSLHPVIATLVEYRKFKKLDEFCQLADDINPVTKRIHTDFRQNGTTSGRMSSANPNLQQIPARSDEAKEFRALFKAQPNHVFVGADYSGIELVIIAHDAKEQILIDAINSNKDLHCFTMSHFLQCDYDMLVSLKEGKEITPEQQVLFTDARNKFETQFYLPQLLKKKEPTAWVNTFRDYVKTISYGLVYGQTAFGLSKKFHCEYIEAEMFIQRFFVVYPKIKKFLSKIEEKVMFTYYAENPMNRRRYFSKPRKKTQEEVEELVMKELRKEKRLWESVDDDEWNALMVEAMKEANKEYNSRFNSIKRQAGNFYPQSICAEMVKQATVNIHKKWKKVNPNTGLILSIHDELIGEFTKEEAPQAVELIESEMQKSAERFLPNIDTKVTAKIMSVWEK